MCASALLLVLVGCSYQGDNKDELRDFAIDNWSSSIGAINENNIDNSDEQKYSYTLYLISETEKLEKVNEIVPIVAENVNDRIITYDLTKRVLGEDSIEIYIEYIFDASGLTKEQIIEELEPFINAVKIVTDDNDEYVVELSARK